LRASSHISWRALGRASLEISEEVRSLFARNGGSSFNERVGQEMKDAPLEMPPSGIVSILCG